MAPSRLLLPSINAIRVWTRPLSSALSVARPRFSYQAAPKTHRPIVMANVTKANFWETYEQLVIHLQTADFVALDFEMTGVETTPWRRHSELDTCDTRYLHIKHSAESFAVWQCGVCPFKWDEPGQKFIAYPYNFYIFPRNELPVEMSSRSYFCQTASLEFLAKHRFDFNTTVYNGVSYLSREQEELARDKLGLTEEAQKWKRLQAEMEPEIPLTRTGDVVFSEKVRVQLGQWRDGVVRNQQRGEWTDPGGGGRRTSLSNTETVIREKGVEGCKDTPSSSSSEKDRAASDGSFISLLPSYIVDIFGNNQARLVKQVLRKHFQDLVAVVIDKPNGEDRKQVKVFFTTSKEHKLRLQAELEEENRKKLEAVVFQAVGFRKVIDAIEASGIPLVGHNCLLDLAHLHDKFLGPLPSNVRGFSASIARHFPCILDTKYLLKTEPTLREANSRSTSLAIVYQQLCQGFSDPAGIPGRFYNGKPRIVTRPISRVKVEIASELQRYSGGTDTGLKHEAGFDAYMTGSVFAQVCHLLQVDTATIRSLPQAAMSEVDSRSGFASYTNLLMLQTFKGQLALDLRTGKEALGDRAPRGPQAPPYRLLNRENVILVWGQSSKIQDHILRKMVQNVFSKEKRLANVDIVSVDESSAFVEFRSAAILEAFMRGFEVALGDSSNSEGLLDVRDFKIARFAAYERICRSPLSTETLGISADLLRISHFEGVVGINNSNRSEITEVRASPHQEPSSLNGGIQTSADNEFRFIEGEPAKEEYAAACWSPEDGLVTDDIRSPPGSTTKSNLGLDPRSSAKDILPAGIDADSPDVQHGAEEGNETPTVTSSYSRWMKRVFDEDDASPSAPPKKRRTIEDPKDGSGAGSL